MRQFRYVFLAAAALALAAAATVKLRFAHTEKAEYAEIVQENVKASLERALSQSRALMLAIKANARQGGQLLSFSELREKDEAAYPTFVFQQGRPVYWNDNSVKVDYKEDFRTSFQERCIENKSGVFIALKIVFSAESGSPSIGEADYYEMVTLVPLGRKRPLRNSAWRSVGWRTADRMAAWHASDASADGDRPDEREREIDDREELMLDPSVFPSDDVLPIPIASSSLADAPYSVRGSLNQEALFTIDFPRDFSHQSKALSWALLALTLLFISAMVAQLRLALDALLKRRPAWALVTLAVGLGAIRALMIWLDVPHQIAGTALFDRPLAPPYRFSPSLGDLALNVAAVTTVVGFLFRHHLRIIPYRRIFALPRLWKRALGVGMFVLSFFTLYEVYELADSLHMMADPMMDIASSVGFSAERVVGMLTFVLGGVNYFLICHLSARALIRTSHAQQQAFVELLLGLSLSASLYLWAEKEVVSFVLPANTAYMATIIALNFPDTFRRSRAATTARYTTYVYMFAAAGVVSALSAFAIYHRDVQETLREQNSLSNDLRLGRDVRVEQCLMKVNRTLDSDSLGNRHKLYARFQEPLENPAVAEDLAEDVKGTFLAPYSPLDWYEIEVAVYDRERRLRHGSFEYDELMGMDWQYVGENVHYTEQRSKETESYLCLNRIYYEEDTVGTLAVLLRMRKAADNSFWQIWVKSSAEERRKQKKLPYKLRSAFDYAIYDREGEGLKHSKGDFFYYNDFIEKFHPEGKPTVWLLSSDGYEHLHATRKSGGKTLEIVVSAPQYSTKRLLSNFSFAFLSQVLVVLLLSLASTLLFTGKDWHVSFVTRIQLYLNLAFFLPVVILCAVVVNIMNASNQESIQRRYLERAELIASSLADEVAEHHADRSTTVPLKRGVERLSDLTKTNIDLYSASKGELLATSQPEIHESGLLGKRLNALAYAQIVEQRRHKLLVEERAGQLSFNYAYVGIRDGGEIIGVVGIPFFGAAVESDRRVIQVVTTIQNVFTLFFVILLFSSYAAARQLTRPLKLLARKISKTSLSERNDPLDYRSDDAIGTMVKEYNQMLVKLEQSKAALARSQRESAWRDMARRVAHEIKNPLTPIKLTMQRLERQLGDGRADPQKVGRYFHTVHHHIDVLADIATAFSKFAAMPIPEPKEFEVGELVRVCGTLHQEGTDAEVRVLVPEGEVIVLSDPTALQRTLNNLIKNGIEAVPEGRTPRIHLILQPFPEEGNALIEVRDNGEGIPESVRQRVFAPDVTTKSERGGSGLGLAMAKHDIDHSGGEIWFETETGQGTSFFVQLPLIEWRVDGEQTARPQD